jgi:hypothetical protein
MAGRRRQPLLLQSGRAAYLAVAISVLTAWQDCRLDRR